MRNRKMEQTKEQKESGKILEKDKKPEEKFSSFWGAESWPKGGDEKNGENQKDG